MKSTSTNPSILYTPVHNICIKQIYTLYVFGSCGKGKFFKGEIMQGNNNTEYPVTSTQNGSTFKNKLMHGLQQPSYHEIGSATKLLNLSIINTLQTVARTKYFFWVPTSSNQCAMANRETSTMNNITVDNNHESFGEV